MKCIKCSKFGIEALCSRCKYLFGEPVVVHYPRKKSKRGRPSGIPSAGSVAKALLSREYRVQRMAKLKNAPELTKLNDLESLLNYRGNQ